MARIGVGPEAQWLDRGRIDRRQIGGPFGLGWLRDRMSGLLVQSVRIEPSLAGRIHLTQLSPAITGEMEGCLVCPRVVAV